MDPCRCRLAAVALLASLLGVGACTSTPSRFYILNTMTASETRPAMAAEQGPVIGVGPITVPKYLERPQIVTRAGRHQLALGEFDRWAEPLPDNMTRVLAENLALLIPTDHILLQGWPRSATPDYQVQVEVLQFESWLGGESALIARWSLLDQAEKTLFSRMVHLQAPTGGQEYEAMVVALNQMLEALSRDIAAAIQRLASRAVAHEEAAHAE